MIFTSSTLSKDANRETLGPIIWHITLTPQQTLQQNLGMIVWQRTIDVCHSFEQHRLFRDTMIIVLGDEVRSVVPDCQRGGPKAEHLMAGANDERSPGAPYRVRNDVGSPP